MKVTILRPSRTRVTGLILAVALPVSAGCQNPQTAWIGLNMQLGHIDYGGEWPSAKGTASDRETYFSLVRDLGVHHARDLFMSWHRCEPQPGKPYDFSLSDDLARRAAAADTDLLAVCSVIPSWAAAQGSSVSWSFGVPRRDQSDAFVRFVAAFVDRYDGNGTRDMPGLRRPVRCYEFMTEEEYVPAAEYAYWLQLFYKTVKRVNPKVQVVLGGLSSPGLKSVSRPQGNYDTYFERLLGCAELAGPAYPYFDVAAFHNYPMNYPGRQPFVDSLDYMRRTMAARQIHRPIWLTAYGAQNSGDTAAALNRQACDVVKYTVQARALGLERAYLHSLWDYRAPGHPSRSENYGLVTDTPAGRPPVTKPSFRAFKLLVEQLEHTSGVRYLQDGAYAIEGGKENRYVVWHEEAYAPPARRGPFQDSWWNVLYLDGRTAVRQGSALLPQLKDPIFLTPTSSPFLR